MPGSSRKQEVVSMGGVTPSQEGQKGHLGASNVGSSCPQTAWTYLGLGMWQERGPRCRSKAVGVLVGLEVWGQ